MANAIARSLCEIDGLVPVCGDAAASEMLAERAVAQEDDVIAVAMFLGPGTGLASAAAVIAHADQRALVEQVESQRIVIEALRHHRHGTRSVASRKYRVPHHARDQSGSLISAALCR